MMKSVFDFTLKALFIHKIFKFLALHHSEKQFDEKDKINLAIYDVKNLEKENCNTHITQYLKNLRQSNNEVWSVNRI